MRGIDRGKRLIAVFVLGIVLLNFPLLAVIDASGRWLGLPALYVYLFGAWGALIACLAWIVERRSQPWTRESDGAE